MDQTVLELAKLIQGIAPWMWEAAEQRLRVEMASAGLWFGALVGIAVAARVIGFRVLDKLERERYDWDKDMVQGGKAVLLFVSIMTLLLSLIVLSELVNAAFAYDYAVLETLLDLAS